MKKFLIVSLALFFTVAIFLFVGWFLLQKYPGLTRKDAGKFDNASSGSTFSKFIAEQPYVFDIDVGSYPGDKILNIGAEEFYEIQSSRETSALLDKTYKFYLVAAIEDRNNGLVTLYEEGTDSKRRVFKCSGDRVFAMKNRNFSFISSGFDFMETLSVGDRVYTKCLNSDCTTLGPDCIIVKEIE
ncbi:MAG: hypothetical protein UU64_C0008G0018 [candidate division WWE3 bacterium GW2011_GWF2_41_45]|uniref:Uncharacterized protein n=3 Tax=Katanobacteria TaxID=422282 RepID=A0A1F4W222_UNCKA|nr:MAG: hypothetical protein UU55_C0003G0014 [candidate division WWE3 bacterium GW2011_GWC2_41_23]KKS10150.1 MAG: hypothetical protein UU64_C0008G0018 [candidate division WWE3 bacterium GW2011_GWF2_41_45]KKS19925.1 MAG: hypothetical protein UU79_C0007G0014 [candidate division WWE3 bacterium GW2011_GWE1_41_72]KKS28540.1 MAG: hypothetical protein UU90_C0024G0002 [candidate division WWE3 bacterium GW2011_GWD2_42_11]KKS50583.1 MAG: hypothetical protein UV16_C0008G0013 [candidate division WWE3 bacte